MGSCSKHTPIEIKSLEAGHRNDFEHPRPPTGPVSQTAPSTFFSKLAEENDKILYVASIEQQKDIPCRWFFSFGFFFGGFFGHACSVYLLNSFLSDGLVFEDGLVFVCFLFMPILIDLHWMKIFGLCLKQRVVLCICSKKN